MSIPPIDHDIYRPERTTAASYQEPEEKTSKSDYLAPLTEPMKRIWERTTAPFRIWDEDRMVSPGAGFIVGGASGMFLGTAAMSMMIPPTAGAIMLVPFLAGVAASTTIGGFVGYVAAPFLVRTVGSALLLPISLAVDLVPGMIAGARKAIRRHKETSGSKKQAHQKPPANLSSQIAGSQQNPFPHLEKNFFNATTSVGAKTNIPPQQSVKIGRPSHPQPG